MAIDYSLLAIPKSRVKALDKDDQRKALAAKDKAENAKARKRAGGQCEIRTALVGKLFTRCKRAGVDPHHLIYGSGRRNRGKSILADYKLWVCRQCHAAITANVLRPTTAEHTAATVRFWRAR
jgi:hypothetical protein